MGSLLAHGHSGQWPWHRPINYFSDFSTSALASFAGVSNCRQRLDSQVSTFPFGFLTINAATPGSLSATANPASGPSTLMPVERPSVVVAFGATTVTEQRSGKAMPV